MRLIEIRTAGFRNLVPDSISWSGTSNLVAGANGQGKTNILEAVAVLGNLRSFRVPSMRQVVTHGEQEFFLEGRVETLTGVVRLSQHLMVGSPIRRALEIAGATASVSQYLQVFPVFTLSGSDRELVAGGPSTRRAFLDRFAFLLENEFFDEVLSYRRTLRQRNAALASAVDDREMEVWENRLARAAAVVVHRRRRMSERLIESFEPIYSELHGGDFPRVELGYRGEAGFEQAEKVSELEEHYRKRYNETRARDRRTGFTNEGPHRHDLGLRADGRSVRHMLSSGQSKVVAAADKVDEQESSLSNTVENMENGAFSTNTRQGLVELNLKNNKEEYFAQNQDQIKQLLNQPYMTGANSRYSNEVLLPMYYRKIEQLGMNIILDIDSIISD